MKPPGKTHGIYERAKETATRIIRKDHRNLAWWLKWPHYLFKLLVFTFRKFWHDGVFARSATLAYSTILALVPLIASLLLVLTIIPEPEDKSQSHAAGTKSFVFKLFIPTSEAGIERYLDDLATNLSESVGKLIQGSTGTISILTLLGLVLTIVFLLNTIEESLNDIWRTIRSRSWISKFRNSWVILTIGPVFIFLSYFLTVWLTQRQVEDAVETPFMLNLFLQTLPYLLSIVFFFFIYALVPFTRVHLFNALIAAVVAGALWNISKEGFNEYVRRAVYYQQVFGRVAILPLFLIWIYASWIITLFGAELAFCHQNFAIIDTQGPDALATDNVSREYVAVRAVLEICWAHERGKPPVTLTRLAKKIKVSELLLVEIIEELIKEKILHTVGENEYNYFPSKPAQHIKLSDVVVPARSNALLVPPNTGLAGDILLANVFTKARVAATKPLEEINFADLMGTAPAPDGSDDPEEPNEQKEST